MANANPAVTFTALERAVLKEIASRDPDIGAALQAQFDAATVTSRKNTGVGFFTDFVVDRAVALVSSRETFFGDIVAGITGFQGPMMFLVFIEDGYANCLEGATTDDSTVGLDLHALEFRILPI